MKAYQYNKRLQFLAILLLILVIALGCASTKYIQNDQSIVKRVEIDSIGKKYKEQALNYVQKSIRPASGLGINVLIYNIFNTKKGKYKTSKIKPLGEPPPILDSTLVEISRTQIEKFLKSKGYFKAQVKTEIKIKNKRAKLKFTANTGPAFIINKITYDILDKEINDLFQANKSKFSHLRENMQYDEDSLVYDREQIYQLLRQNGYYDFVRPYIRVVIDSNQNNSKAAVKLIIDKPINESEKHQVYTINEVDVLVAPNSDGFTDSVILNKKIFKGIRFTDLSKKFRRNPIVRYNFIKPGETYDILKDQLTYDRLYQLGVFKSVKIEYTKLADGTKLNSFIEVIPQKRMSNRVEGEIPFNQGTVGFSLSNTFVNANMLSGAERFQFQIKGGLQSRNDIRQPFFKDIYQRDFSVSASLAIPRLLAPFRIPLMGKNGLPYTTFSVSYLYALQKNIFTRRLFAVSFAYDWVETRDKLHSLTLLNLEYRFGELQKSTLGRDFVFKNISDSLLNRKNITMGIKYSYTLNAPKLLEFRDFVYFRGTMETAGNLTYLASGLAKVDINPEAGIYGKFLGQPYYQFIRPEIDIRYYKTLGGKQQFVTRLTAGIGYAYGNSTEVPFEKLFFAGGSNGIRAWQARTLGPGNYNRAGQSEESRRFFFGVDQLGSLMMQANLEYRFNLTDRFLGGKLNAATFVDFGNVWTLKEKFPGSKTVLKNIGKQIAVGTGFGLRYDLQYFVFRFDIGLKIKDPQFEGKEQWVINKFLTGGRQFKSNYYQSHSPQQYRFIQYNFGIGMPF